VSFQLQGGNPATNDYDYQSGSGMDNFMSRSIDEVSWQSNLGSVYTTLSELPIGLSPTTATPTNYDATQITGSQSGTTTVGGTGTSNPSGGGVAASGAASGLSINPTQQTITLSDGTNDRLILGQGNF
jgi:hypothetical protein